MNSESNTVNVNGQLIQGQTPSDWIKDLLADYAQMLREQVRDLAEDWEIADTKKALAETRRAAKGFGLTKADVDTAIALGNARVMA